MKVTSSFTSYPLKTRIIILAVGALFFWIALMFPLLSYTFEGLLNRSVKAIEEAQGVAATTIARLMVLEFSQWQDLLQMVFAEPKQGEERIKNLLWEKVVFNEVIEGIELIQAATDATDHHLTYLYYRSEVPDPTAGPRDKKTLKPMEGPQKINKKFSGLEKDLIDSINNRKRVDKNLLESINRGPIGSEKAVRYVPVHVLVSGQGAVYWGVAKISVNTSAIRLMRLQQGVEYDWIRRIIWLEIFLSLGVVAILATSLAYHWIRNYTEPLKSLGLVARNLTAAKPEEFNFWFDNLRLIDAKEQPEIASLREILLRMSAALHKTGQRLIATEREAVWGRVAAGVISAALDRLKKVRTLESQPGADSPQPSKELSELFNQLRTELQDLQQLSPTNQTAWRIFDLAPVLQSAWNLVTAGLPAAVQQSLDLSALPPVWGSPDELGLAFLYLLEYAGTVLTPGGEITLQALPDSAATMRISLQFSGPQLSPEECRDLLNPFQDPEGIRGSLGPALAAAIAAQHRGSLQLQPWERGLRFLVELPKAPATDDT
jgi:signal transduction histidine kinase